MKYSYICSKSTPVHFLIESVVTSESTLKEWLMQLASKTSAEEFKEVVGKRWVITTDLRRAVGDRIQKSDSRMWSIDSVMDWDNDELVEELNSINGVEKFNVVF